MAMIKQGSVTPMDIAATLRSADGEEKKCLKYYNNNIPLYKYIITPVIGFGACPHTSCAQSPLPGEHSSQALLNAQKLFDQQYI